MFIIYKDNSYGLTWPIFIVKTDIEYEEIHLKYIFKTLKDSITKSYKLYKYKDSYFLTEEDNVLVGLKTKQGWTVLQLFASADDTIKNYLKGL